MRLPIAALLLLVATTAYADAPCKKYQRRFDARNEGLAITLDGGQVIGDSFTEGDDVPLGAFTLKTKTGTVQPSVTMLAPGLVRYGLPAGVSEAELMLGDSAVTHVWLTKDATTLPAPVLKDARVHVRDTGTDRTEMLAISADAAPKGTVAAIVLDGTGKTPRGYASPVAGTLEFGFVQAARCQAVPAGTIATKVGEKITLRWVDIRGRLSPISRPIKVVAGRRR